MHAIGNEVLKGHKDFKILYVTSERFTNEFIDAIKTNKMDTFHNKYRNIDVLLIDDFQNVIKKRIRRMRSNQPCRMSSLESYPFFTKIEKL